jgi:hypothetical protein
VEPAAVADRDVQVLHRPELDAKIRDVVGLHLAPPDKAVVVCIDENSWVQALDGTAPILPHRKTTSRSGTSDVQDRAYSGTSWRRELWLREFLCRRAAPSRGGLSSSCGLTAQQVIPHLRDSPNPLCSR